MSADGPDVFRNFIYTAEVPETRYVRGLEFRPATPRAVHHATIAVDRSAKSRFYDRQDAEPGFDGMINSSAERPDGHMLGWVPGKVPHAVPEQIAWPLEPGTDLIVQLHLQPTGKAVSIHPTIGLFFADEPPSRTPFMIRLGPRTIDVAPGETDYAIADSFVLPVDVEVLGLVPHAHYLGKQMQGYATLPDGTKRWLIYIKEWDFDWQDEYRFAEPVFLPKGSTLSMRFTYDNSAGNVRNPHDPPRRVVFGPKTTDEMGDLWIQVLPRTEEDRQLLEREFVRKELQANLDCYEKMLELAPEDVTVRVELGELHHRQGALDKAITEYRRALRVDPDYVPAHAAIGRALHSRGAVEDAVAHSRRALELMPGLAEVHFNLGQSLRVLGRLDESIEQYRLALELSPALAPAHHNLGEVLRARGRLDEAVEQYRTALRIDPDYPQAHNNLGSVLASQGRMDGAMRHFRLAVKNDPDYAQAHNNLGMALASEGKLDEAIDHFTLAVRLRPDHAPSQRNLAMALRMREKSSDAPN